MVTASNVNMRGEGAYLSTTDRDKIRKCLICQVVVVVLLGRGGGSLLIISLICTPASQPASLECNK